MIRQTDRQTEGEQGKAASKVSLVVIYPGNDQTDRQTERGGARKGGQQGFFGGNLPWL